MRALLDDGEPQVDEKKPKTPPQEQIFAAVPGDPSEPSKKTSEHVTTPKTSVRAPRIV